MKKLLFIFLLAPFLSKSQSTIITSSDRGVFDLQNKVVTITGILSGITLKNAILNENPYIQLFDTTVILEGCTAKEFSTAWYGANKNKADNWKELQLSFDACLNNKFPTLYIADSYTISKQWKMANLSKNSYIGWSLHVKGDGNIWNDRTKITYTGTSYALGLQCAKGVIIEGIAIKGNYSAPTNEGMSYYNTNFPVQSYNAGIMIDFDGSKNTSGSTGVKIQNCWVDGFDVCYDISPNGKTFNADIITLEDIRVGNCRIGVRSGQAQEKGNEIRNIVAWDRCQILIQIGKSGKYQAGSYIIRGGNIAGNVVQLFDVQCSGWNKFIVYGMDAESIARIGFFGSSTSQHRIPILIEGLTARLKTKQFTGEQTIVTSQADRLRFSNCNIWYYGVVGDFIRLTGKGVYDNCDFGASRIKTDYSTFTGNILGIYYLPLNTVLGKPYFQY